MLEYEIVTNPETNEKQIALSLKGKALLTIPQLNKGTAFTRDERVMFDLLGKLPPRVETLEEQTKRAYMQYSAYTSQLQKHIYLNNLNDKNQVLFFKLVTEHLQEMLPSIYTPSVGMAVKFFSQEFRQPRGLFISYDDQDHIRSILASRTNPEVDVIVITDGEGVLGIGDQGVGGIDIPIAKLMIYTLFAGIDPMRTLPIQLDVGTNNQTILDDPFYLGRRKERLSPEEYDPFIAKFIKALREEFPNAFIHWEDLGRRNAYQILHDYEKSLCTFNDDIQGTGVVTLAALLAAVKSKGEKISDQRILIYGAGSAGMGIAHRLHDAMLREGIDDQIAKQNFWLFDRPGLLLENTNGLTPNQVQFARHPDEVSDWQLPVDLITLENVIQHIQPTILIGCSTVSGAFNQHVVQAMCKHNERPIIFPLSNPNECAEATPDQIIAYSDGKAIIATGSPFDNVIYDNRDYIIAQNNNALAFPGIGLGVVATKSRQLTENMLWAACNAIRDCAPILNDPDAPPLPPLSHGRDVARRVAIAVAKQAMEDQVEQVSKDSDPEKLVDEHMWEPMYHPYILK